MEIKVDWVSKDDTNIRNHESIRDDSIAFKLNNSVEIDFWTQLGYFLFCIYDMHFSFFLQLKMAIFYLWHEDCFLVCILEVNFHCNKINGMPNFVHRCLWAFYPGEMVRAFHWIPIGVHDPKQAKNNWWSEMRSRSRIIYWAYGRRSDTSWICRGSWSC